MTKDDWLKLAMPASITLLALAVITTPLLANARITQAGSRMYPIHIKILE